MFPFPHATAIAIIPVGLPARGKTYTSRKLARYLAWHGYTTRVFNVGNYRRAMVGAQVPASFFDPDNEDSRGAREAVAQSALDDMLQWFREGGQVGVYDATNTTRARRVQLAQACEEASIRPVFVEFQCDDPAIIESNIRETKLSAPDYVGIDPDQAVADFRTRIAHYQKAYEPLADDALSYVRLVDVGRQVVANRLRGPLEGKILSFLMNLHIAPRSVWLTRHGQSRDNVRGLLGGDSALSEKGELYALQLAERLRDTSPLEVWCSTLRRTNQTAEALGRPFTRIKALDEIDAGICDGLTYADIARDHPDIHRARRQDKLRYRYPQGESYEDVINRLDPVILELERQQHEVLVVAHQAVLRALYAYFADRSREECPHLEVPLHTLIKLVPRAYDCAEERIYLGAEEVRGGGSG